MTRKKLTPFAPKNTKTDLKTLIATDDPQAKIPRMLAQHPRLKERRSNHPEVLINKRSYETTSTKILRNSTTNQSVDSYLQVIFRKESPNHRYPTRTRVA